MMPLETGERVAGAVSGLWRRKMRRLRCCAGGLSGVARHAAAGSAEEGTAS